MLKKNLQRIFLMVIVFLSVKTALQNLQSDKSDQSEDMAAVVIWNERVSQLIAPIPFKRGLVGYISSEDIAGAAFDSADTEGEFVLTQYALAPLILVRGAEQEWNILNIDALSYQKWLQAHADNFELVQSGGGLYLVRRVRP
jgi:hypothetical protein